MWNTDSVYMKLKCVFHQLSFACVYKPLLLQNVNCLGGLQLAEEGIKKPHMCSLFCADSANLITCMCLPSC